MSKRLIAIIFSVLVILVGTPIHVFADDYAGADDWNVVVSPNGQMISNFSSSDIEVVTEEMQPGDTVVFQVSVENQYKETADIYMSNTVLRSLEDNTSAAGGAYTYILQYKGPNDSDFSDIFNSDTVGGDNLSGDREGLHEATSALEGYFELDTLDPNQKGVVKLTVIFEGETQGNDYQTTQAELQFNFATVFLDKPPVNTGYEQNLLPLYILMFVSGGLLFIILLFALLKRREEAEG